jgi:tRNA(Arg) A34 adenosine deaminase TadA
MLLFAAKIAIPNFNDKRHFWLGCIGLRRDGALVHSKNGAVYSTIVDDYQLIPESHAECRVLRKMDYGGVLYVARVMRKDMSLAMARPCPMCMIKIKSKGIKKVYYTVNNYQYGLFIVKSNHDTIFSN